MRILEISLVLVLASGCQLASAEAPRDDVPNVADTARAIDYLGSAEKAALAKMSARDERIHRLKGRTIAEKEVREVAHLARLDPRSLSDRDRGRFVVLSDASVVDSLANFAEFNTSAPAEDTKTPSIAFTFVPQPDDVGRLYVVAFNVYSFTSSFEYELVLSANGETRRRATKGIGKGNHRVPRYFVVTSSDPINISFAPKSDSRWWFGSCDVYALR